MIFGAFVLGELCSRIAPGIILAAAGLLSAGIALWCQRRKRSRWRLSLPLFLLAGFLLAAQARKAAWPELWLESRGGSGETILSGTILRTEEREEETWLYVKGRLSGCEKETPAGFLVLLPSGRDMVWLPGMEIEAKGVLEAFSKADNTGQFDYRSYYRAGGWFGRLKAETWKRTDGRAWFCRGLLTRLRLFLSEVIDSFADGREAGILKAILLGERWEVPKEVRNLYQANGISHLLAISGLHISFLGLGLYGVIRRLTGSYPAAGFLGVLFVGGYGYMVGESPSALRACMMFGVLALGNALGRTYDLLSAVSLSGLLLLWQHPLLYGQASFQLSMGAVFGIGFLEPVFSSFLSHKGKGLSSCLSSLAVSYTILPVLLFHYYEFPVQSLFLNLLVLPFAGILMGAGVLGTAAGCLSPGAAHFFLGTVHVILNGYEALCGLGKVLSLNLVTGRPPDWKLGAYILLLSGLYAVLEMCSKKRKKAEGRTEKGISKEKGNMAGISLPPFGEWIADLCRLGLLFGFFFLSLFFFLPKPDGRLSVSVLDVGQGDSIFIQGTDGTAVLLDGGSSSRRDLGPQCLIPFLKARGVRALDYMILTHMDGDHSSGIRQLLEADFPVKKILISCQTAKSRSWDAWESLLLEKQVTLQVINAGEKLSLGKASLFCLWPEAGWEGLSENNSSLVFSLTWNQFSMLLAGDLEEAGERALLSSGMLPAGVTVLKAGHHGSSGSSSGAFLNWLSPQAVLVSCGKNNPYGHPHKEALERFRQAGSRIYLTMERGELRIRTDGKKTTLSAFH